jgi:hypothetical protein
LQGVKLVKLNSVNATMMVTVDENTGKKKHSQKKHSDEALQTEMK